MIYVCKGCADRKSDQPHRSAITKPWLCADCNRKARGALKKKEERITEAKDKLRALTVKTRAA